MIKDLLKNINLFKKLSDIELNKLSTICKIEHYEKNSIVFYENENLFNMYYLIKGKVKLYKIDKYNNEVFLNNIYKNSFIHILKNTRKDHFSCNSFFSVATLEASDILLIDVEAFKKEFLHKQSILDNYLEEIYFFMEQFQYIINRDLVFDSKAKVAYMLCNNLKEFNKLKKNEVAYHLHLQPETLSRITKKLEKDGYIKNEQRNVTILNRYALESLYK